MTQRNSIGPGAKQIFLFRELASRSCPSSFDVASAGPAAISSRSSRRRLDRVERRRAASPRPSAFTELSGGSPGPHPDQAGEPHLAWPDRPGRRADCACSCCRPARRTLARRRPRRRSCLNTRNSESRNTSERSRDLQPAAEIRLVRSVASRSPRRTASGGSAARSTGRSPEDLLHQRLDEAVDGLRPRERDLDVHLRELELAVGALILVAEAADDLEVAIGPGDHQDLLEDLRRLRQRVELAGMHAARHEEVARALGRRLGQNRRFDLPEAVGVEVAANRHRHAVAQADVVLQARPPQIEIAVAQPHVLGHRRVLGDLERRRLRFVEHADLAREHLDLAGRELRIDRVFRSALDRSGDADDELGAQPLGAAISASFSRTTTCDTPGAVADIDEGDAAEIAGSGAHQPPTTRRVGPHVVSCAARRTCGFWSTTRSGSAIESRLCRMSQPRRARRMSGRRCAGPSSPLLLARAHRRLG